MTTQAAGEKLLAQPGYRPHLPGMTRSAQVPGGTRPAGQVSHEPPPRGRIARLFEAADRRHVPLRTILVTVAVVVATYLAGQLIYRLRDIVLLMLVAGFVAMLLNPVVAKVQRHAERRGLAVTIVTLCAALVFISLAAAFGVPLVNGITHLGHRMPGYVASAQHGNGWIGHLVARYHVQSWVQRNTPGLVGYAQSLSKPALTVGKGAVSLMVELFTLFVLVLLLLLEGPKMWTWTLGQMTPGRQGHGHPDSGRRQPEGYRVHVRQPADLIHRRDGGVRDAADPRRAVPAAVGPVGGPGGLLADDRRGPGRHPHRPVRVHRRGPDRGHRHRDRFRRLHPDREPRPEPGGHEQDGADQPAARVRRGAGRRLARWPDRRHIRGFRRGAAGHPDGRGAAGPGQGGLAGHRPGPAPGSPGASG